VSAPVLSPAQLRHFGEFGWLKLDDLLEVGVDELQTEVDRVAAIDEGGTVLQHFELTDSGRQLARSEDFTPVSPLLFALLRRGAVPDVAGQLMNEPVLLYKEKVNYKAPGGAGFAPHQDKPAYPFVNKVLSAMVAVDDATVENGCLWVVDGRHQDVLAQDDRGCIAAAVVDQLEWHEVALAAGEVLFFDALTPHRSFANDSTLPRRALYPTYNAAAEGDLRDAYYEEKRRQFAESTADDRVRLSLIGDFEGRPA
jgi:2-aminoethylphosphonate dioxygenase